MEPDVLNAMAKWPDVPDVYGWLELDRHGRWLLRGEPITHPQSKAFIAKNYGVDPRGCWFFQNGPQRVFVELACTPWIFHWVSPHWCHQGGERVAQVYRALIDPDGLLLLDTNWGPGLVNHLDLAFAASLVCQKDGQPLTDEAEQAFFDEKPQSNHLELAFRWQNRLIPLEKLPDRDIAGRFGFVQKPQESKGR